MYLGDVFETKELSAIHGDLLTAWGSAGVAGPILVSKVLRESTATRWSSTSSPRRWSSGWLLSSLCTTQPKPSERTEPVRSPQLSEIRSCEHPFCRAPPPVESCLAFRRRHHWHLISSERSCVDTRFRRSARSQLRLVIPGLVAVLGILAFWMWRRNAPLARHLRRHDRRRRKPNPERTPGTDPI